MDAGWDSSFGEVEQKSLRGSKNLVFILKDKNTKVEDRTNSCSESILRPESRILVRTMKTWFFKGVDASD